MTSSSLLSTLTFSLSEATFYLSILVRSTMGLFGFFNHFSLLGWQNYISNEQDCPVTSWIWALFILSSQILTLKFQKGFTMSHYHCKSLYCNSFVLIFKMYIIITVNWYLWSVFLFYSFPSCCIFLLLFKCLILFICVTNSPPNSPIFSQLTSLVEDQLCQAVCHLPKESAAIRALSWRLWTSSWAEFPIQVEFSTES